MKRRTRHAVAWCLLSAALTVQGCGLLIDTVKLVANPKLPHEVDAICSRERVHIGIGVEPRRPFVFPAIWTDEGPRVTGFDVELIQAITARLSRHCGKPVTPVLHLVRFRDLFLYLNEGQLDLFVSAISANAPSPTAAGVAYSLPYFSNAGLTVITKRPEAAERVRANLRRGGWRPGQAFADGGALAGLTVAVQESTSFHWYAQGNLAESRLVLCDSLPAALEADDPSIEVFLGGLPVLGFIVTRTETPWRLITTDDGRPVILMREHYSVVMDEESYRLRWLVNNLLFQMEESGELERMRRRWLEEEYAYPRRAETEGLPFKIEDMVEHYNQGQCRPAASH